MSILSLPKFWQISNRQISTRLLSTIKNGPYNKHKSRSRSRSKPRKRKKKPPPLQPPQVILGRTNLVQKSPESLLKVANILEEKPAQVKVPSEFNLVQKSEVIKFGTISVKPEEAQEVSRIHYIRGKNPGRSTCPELEELSTREDLTRTEAIQAIHKYSSKIHQFTARDIRDYLTLLKNGDYYDYEICRNLVTKMIESLNRSMVMGTAMTCYEVCFFLKDFTRPKELLVLFERSKDHIVEFSCHQIVAIIDYLFNLPYFDKNLFLLCIDRIEPEILSTTSSYKVWKSIRKVRDERVINLSERLYFALICKKDPLYILQSMHKKDLNDYQVQNYQRFISRKTTSKLSVIIYKLYYLYPTNINNNHIIFRLTIEKLIERKDEVTIADIVFLFKPLIFFREQDFTFTNAECLLRDFLISCVYEKYEKFDQIKLLKCMEWLSEIGHYDEKLIELILNKFRQNSPQNNLFGHDVHMLEYLSKLGYYNGDFVNEKLSQLIEPKNNLRIYASDIIGSIVMYDKWSSKVDSRLFKQAVEIAIQDIKASDAKKLSKVKFALSIEKDKDIWLVPELEILQVLNSTKPPLHESFQEIAQMLNRVEYRRFAFQEGSHAKGVGVDFYSLSSQVVIEADGPLQFYSNLPQQPTPWTSFRRRILRGMGCTVITVPWFQKDKEAYLKEKLDDL